VVALGAVLFGVLASAMPDVSTNAMHVPIGSSFSNFNISKSSYFQLPKLADGFG
jgi:hypothetical protein